MAKSSSAKQPRSGKKEATTDFEKMPESGYSKSVVVSPQRGEIPKYVFIYQIQDGAPKIAFSCPISG